MENHRKRMRSGASFFFHASEFIFWDAIYCTFTAHMRKCLILRRSKCRNRSCTSERPWEDQLYWPTEGVRQRGVETPDPQIPPTTRRATSPAMICAHPRHLRSNAARAGWGLTKCPNCEMIRVCQRIPPQFGPGALKRTLVGNDRRAFPRIRP